MSPRTFVRAVVIALLAVCAAGCEKPTEPAPPSAEARKEPFGRMTVDELDAKIASWQAGKIGLAIFDNNDKARFDQGHIPSAKWVKFDALTEADLPPDRGVTLVFYCANEECTACHSGAMAAVKLGYRNVYILPAGIRGWEKAAKPVVRS